MGAKRTGLGQTPAFGHDLTGKYGNASAGMSFFSELKQRNVFRVALLYIVTASLMACLSALNRLVGQSERAIRIA